MSALLLMHFSDATAADAGIVYLQPGIESLSNHMLQLMRKGTTTIQNLSFLKCCRDYGIFVFWNNLIRLPGELEEDYLEMEELIPKIHHLYPPSGGAKRSNATVSVLTSQVGRRARRICDLYPGTQRFILKKKLTEAGLHTTSMPIG